MPWLQWILFPWLILAPTLEINLFPVRGSGIFLGTALLALIILAVGLHVARKPNLIPWHSRLSLPIIALGITAVIAGLQGAMFYDRTVLGQHRYVLVEIYAVGLVGLSLATPFAVAALIRSTRDVARLRLVVVLATVLLLLEVRSSMHGFTVPWWPLVTAYGSALACAWLLFEKHKRWRDYALGGIVVAAVLNQVVVYPFLANVPAQWLSGWIAVTVPLGLLVLIRFPKASLGCVLPALVVFLYWKYPEVQRVYDLAYREGDFGRIRLWEDAIGLAYHRPVFGVGPGNYLDYIMRYGQIGMMLSSPHGNYQQIAAEMGLVGLGFTLWVLVRALCLGWAIYRRSADAFVRSVAIGATCGLAGQAAAAFVGDFLLPSYHNGGYSTLGTTIYAWVMMGVLMTFERLEGHQELPQTTTQTESKEQGSRPRTH